MSDENVGNDGESRTEIVRRAAAAGAEVALSGFRAGLSVDRKSGPTDLVTDADRDAQRAVAAVVESAAPNEPLVGEEVDAMKSVPERGPAWIVDPIDGTNNFVREVPVFATAVAAVVDADPVAGAVHLPALDDRYVAGETTTRNGETISVSDVTDPKRATAAPTIWWPRDRRDEYTAACDAIVREFADLRRPGCAQASLARIAGGALDALVTNVEVNPWDSVAGVHLVRQAGGRVTDLDGDRWTHDARGLVASNGVDRIHEAALSAARAAEAERR